MTIGRDPIGFELFKNTLFSIADEMALTVFRTTYSGVLKDNMDYSTGFADGEGKLVAQGLTLPGHLGSVPTAMESIMRHFRDDMAAGEAAILDEGRRRGIVFETFGAVRVRTRCPPPHAATRVRPIVRAGHPARFAHYYISPQGMMSV